VNARSNSSRSGRDTGKQAPGPSADQPGRSALPLAERRKRHVGTRRAIVAVKAAHAADRTKIEVAADYLTRVASSAPFLIFHVAWFGVWIAWNTRLLGLAPFDPYPFGLLTMIVSLEAIFLSIFVLMSQSREATIAELREEVTLAVNLRMEQEVTKTLQLVVGLYARLGHQLGDDPELDEMLRPLDADRMERDLLAQIEAASPGPGREKKNGAASGQR
jgi:uncharacterized membrane protein